MSQHYGYQQAKVIITNDTYNVVETFTLPNCSSTGKQRSFEFIGSRQETWKNTIIDYSQGHRLKYVLNFNEYANKESVAMFLKILNYSNDGAKGRGKKYMYLMPHLDRPYIIHQVVLNNSTLDLQLLEATDYTDGYMLPVLEFISVDLVDPYDTITEFPTSPDIWLKSTEATKYYTEGDANTYVSRIVDQSSFFRNVYAGTTFPKYIASALNGYPAVRFNGTDNTLQSLAWALEQDLTLYAVLKVISFTSGRYIFDGYHSNRLITKFTGTTPDLSFSADNTHSITANIGVYTGVILEIASRVEENSEIIINNTAATPGFAGANDPSGITIGSKADLTNFSNIDLFELLIFPSYHNSSQKLQVRNYLSRKYFNTTY